MTYAQYINILQASWKLKVDKTKKLFVNGFSNADEIISYLYVERDAEDAKIEYFQFFSRCVRMNLDLENEMN